MSRSHPRNAIARRSLGWLVASLLVAGIVVPVSMMNARIEQATAGTTRTLGRPPPARVAAAAGAPVEEHRRDAKAPKATRSRRQKVANVTSFIWPVGGPWAVTSPYGARGEHGEDFHHGMDIGCAAGQPVRAAFPGRVIFTGDGGAYGNAVLLDHGGSWQTLYGHFNEIVVSLGDWADQGEVIGRCGSTGRSTGPHLHFEIRAAGYVWDPAQYLPG